MKKLLVLLFLIMTFTSFSQDTYIFEVDKLIVIFGDDGRDEGIEIDKLSANIIFEVNTDLIKIYSPDMERYYTKMMITKKEYDEEKNVLYLLSQDMETEMEWLVAVSYETEYTADVIITRGDFGKISFVFECFYSE